MTAPPTSPITIVVAAHPGPPVEANPARVGPPLGAAARVQGVDLSRVVAHHHEAAGQRGAALDGGGGLEGPARPPGLPVDREEAAVVRPHVDQAAHRQGRALDRAAGGGERPERGSGEAVADQRAVHRGHVDGVLGDGRRRGDLAPLAPGPAQLPVVGVEGVDAPGVVPEHHQAVAHRGRELDQRARLEGPGRAPARRPRPDPRHVAVAGRPAAVLGALEPRVVQGDLGRPLPHAGAGRRVSRGGGGDHPDPERQGRLPVGVRGRAGDHGPPAQAAHLHPAHRLPGVPVGHPHGHRGSVEQRRRCAGRLAAPAPAAPRRERERERRRDHGRGCPTRAPHAPRGCLATRTSRSPPRAGR